MVTAIVLAGGASRRMGRTKALLPDPDGRPFVARIVRTMIAAGLPRVVVVTGADHEAIAAALAADAPAAAPLCAVNPDPARGQLSSLWTGMAVGISADTQGIAVTLVDVPMLQPATVEAVVRQWRLTRAPVVRPASGGRHGHPVLFDRAVFAELLAAPLAAGAKHVVRAHAHELVDVAVDDEGCFADVDTPEDLTRLQRSVGWR